MIPQLEAMSVEALKARGYDIYVVVQRCQAALAEVNAAIEAKQKAAPAAGEPDATQGDAPVANS